MGSLFGGGGGGQPTPQYAQRSPNGVRIISQFGERVPMSGGVTNVMGTLYKPNDQGGGTRVGAADPWPPQTGTYGGSY